MQKARSLVCLLSERMQQKPVQHLVLVATFQQRPRHPLIVRRQIVQQANKSPPMQMGTQHLVLHHPHIVHLILQLVIASGMITMWSYMLLLLPMRRRPSCSARPEKLK